MHGKKFRILDGNSHGMPPPQILGATHHGGPAGVILWDPVQGLVASPTRPPTTPHHFQHGGIRCDTISGDGGGTQRGGDGELWETSSDTRCGILCIRWTPHIPTAIPDSEVPGCTYRTL